MRSFFNGGASVTATYWGGIVGSSFILKLYVFFFNNQTITNPDWQFVEQLHAVHNYIVLAFTVLFGFLFRAMIKSCFNDRTPGFWGGLGIAIAGLRFATLAFSCFTLFFPSVATPRALIEAELKQLNQQLPMKVDEFVVMQRVKIENDFIVYFYNVEAKLEESERDGMQNMFISDQVLAKEICREIESYLNGGIKGITYDFDYLNTTLSAVLTSEDCAALNR
ncbi:hypothetical protein Q4544_11325 [Cognatishimia sp. 1_MG-2023]|uniref:hypothetical protein n=1 Tax=Cognatishimia sp. 1_MG-2023 TaxID=3062642 RepID=UPI0026E3B1E7|nr:hypothetical protein [Cognatishimia sp. 1_MG-2023]MDO6727525.1 hypothetical protein [Cognatishimia sp. 1_MG-2023]